MKITFVMPSSDLSGGNRVVSGRVGSWIVLAIPIIFCAIHRRILEEFYIFSCIKKPAVVSWIIDTILQSDIQFCFSCTAFLSCDEHNTIGSAGSIMSQGSALDA